MKRLIISILLIMSLGHSATASGFKMGLGKAVAETGTKVLKEAAELDLMSRTGDNAAQSLPSCGSDTPYTISPIVVTDIQGIDPLVHFNPSGHTFPSDHIYFYLRPINPSN